MAEALATGGEHLDLTRHWAGYLAVGIFVLAYLLAMVEDLTQLRKSKPMVLAASVIWGILGWTYAQHGVPDVAATAFRSSLLNYAELLLFILVSMTYLNAMESHAVFDALRVRLLKMGLNYRQLFWITGFLSFVISSVCNNLTTALLMGAVVVALGRDCPRFITLSCISIVVATNAGGSFSPFGDITTLFVWQKGMVPFNEFFRLLLPSIVNYVVPASILFLFIPRERPVAISENVAIRTGGVGIIILFLLTIVTAVLFENLLHLPPAAGMMAGLTYLKFHSYFSQKRSDAPEEDDSALADYLVQGGGEKSAIPPASGGHDVFSEVSRQEWDTLLFFYGVILCMGGLSFIGYLDWTSQMLYSDPDSATWANILVGIVSAFIDNGTIMLAVLTMAPDISQGQWLLVTLTAGVGGSLLAIGSAAGVGLLGQAKGYYSFLIHLKWSPVIALGYFASIATHFLINGDLF
ncbi:MAG: hypothetical protein RIQ52_990 [Pseudomonadota bacterium]